MKAHGDSQARENEVKQLTSFRSFKQIMERAPRAVTPTPERNLSRGKELVLEHIKGEMRRRNLDPALLVFLWHEDTSKLLLRLHRGRNQETVMFGHADVEKWLSRPAMSWAKYSAVIIRAIGRLLQGERVR